MNSFVSAEVNYELFVLSSLRERLLFPFNFKFKRDEEQLKQMYLLLKDKITARTCISATLEECQKCISQLSLPLHPHHV